jgi:uncharacterized membrane protein YhaH (DUF805 family)
MNRFDKTFHGIDHTSGRPFSAGHPDGVWVIAIVYSLLVIVPLLMAALMRSLDPLKPALGASLVFLPPVLLLFLRKKLASIWLTIVAILCIAGAIAGGLKMQREGQLTLIPLLGLAAVAGGQAYIAFYAYRLKRDAVLQ